VHRVENSKYLKVSEGLPQGVRAGVFLKTRNYEESSEGVASLKCSKEDKVELLRRETRIKVIQQKLSSNGRTSIYFAGVIKEQRMVEILCWKFTKSRGS
jgi:hypothetical protein